MKKVLVLLDIDGTILNEKYEITSKNIYDIISKCKERGVIFGFNSNRAIEDMIPLYKELGLNGFIIGENGAFVKFDKEEEIITKMGEDINLLRELLPGYLTKEIKNSKYVLEDTVAFLKNPKIEENSPSILMLSNKFRRYSFSIHMKKLVNGRLEKDLDLTNQGSKIISKLITEKNLSLKVSTSNTFGNILINPSDCNKGSTLKKIIFEKFKDYTTIMIGDDLQDKMVMSVVDFFYAVGNADEEVKRNADYIAQSNFTQGVEEILLNKVLINN